MLLAIFALLVLLISRIDFEENRLLFDTRGPEGEVQEFLLCDPDDDGFNAPWNKSGI
jgi:hypothetical protein